MPKCVVGFVALASLLLFSIAVDDATAVVVLSDDYTYADGPLVGATGSPWTNNSGTAGQQNVVSGELFIDDNESEDTRAEFAGTDFLSGFTTGVLTATFQFRMSSADPSTSGVGQYMIHFIGDTDGSGDPNSFYGKVFLKDASGTDFSIGITNSSSTGSDVNFLSTALSADVSYDLTLTFDIDTGTSSLSVAGVGSVNATDGTASVARMNSFAFRQTSATGDAFIDNLSVSYVAVPEPSAFLFGGLICSVLGVNYARKRMKVAAA